MPASKLKAEIARIHLPTSTFTWFKMVAAPARRRDSLFPDGPHGEEISRALRA
jgi:hypothetical protein